MGKQHCPFCPAWHRAFPSPLGFAERVPAALQGGIGSGPGLCSASGGQGQGFSQNKVQCPNPMPKGWASDRTALIHTGVLTGG